MVYVEHDLMREAVVYSNQLVESAAREVVAKVVAAVVEE
jgi:hypothetical protein